ncbi:heptahelical transmembrane protein ADIPOR1-like [Wolffia australiana]
MCGGGAMCGVPLAEELLLKKKKKTAKEEIEGEGPPRLVTFEELPEYMKENEFIRGYYRMEWSIRHAFLSLFRWHNETLNVWTHLIGFALFVWLTVVNLYPTPEMDMIQKFSRPFSISSNMSLSQAAIFRDSLKLPNLETTATELYSTTTRWPFFVFLAGAMFCLMSSTCCHLFCCHSQRLTIFLLRVDYVGIAVMIVTSFFPPIYYVFRCEPHWQFVYLGTVSAMGVATVVTLFAPQLSGGEYRSLRAALFFCTAFSGVVPAIHATASNWKDPRRPAALACEAAMAVSYAVGTLFYVTRVPERWKPGRFDIAGHSHQIFHILVVAGAVAHYAAATVLMQDGGLSVCV